MDIILFMRYDTKALGKAGPCHLFLCRAKATPWWGIKELELWLYLWASKDALLLCRVWWSGLWETTVVWLNARPFSFLVPFAPTVVSQNFLIKLFLNRCTVNIFVHVSTMVFISNAERIASMMRLCMQIFISMSDNVGCKSICSGNAMVGSSSYFPVFRKSLRGDLVDLCTLQLVLMEMATLLFASFYSYFEWSSVG